MTLAQELYYQDAADVSIYDGNVSAWVRATLDKAAREELEQADPEALRALRARSVEDA